MSCNLIKFSLKVRYLHLNHAIFSQIVQWYFPVVHNDKLYKSILDTQVLE